MPKKVLRFVSKGISPKDTELTDAQTGEHIQNCIKVEFSTEPTQPTRMVATFWDAEIDVTAEADIHMQTNVFHVKASFALPYISGESQKDMRLRIADALILSWGETTEKVS